jgi:hypothetical protein
MGNIQQHNCEGVKIHLSLLLLYAWLDHLNVSRSILLISWRTAFLFNTSRQTKWYVLGLCQPHLTCHCHRRDCWMGVSAKRWNQTITCHDTLALCLTYFNKFVNIFCWLCFFAFSEYGKQIETYEKFNESFPKVASQMWSITVWYYRPSVTSSQGRQKPMVEYLLNRSCIKLLPISNVFHSSFWVQHYSEIILGLQKSQSSRI